MAFEFRDDGIAHQLEDRRLAVPIYQRSYSWTADEIDEFWGDLTASFEAGQKDYFLGTIVVCTPPEGGRYTVTDGQQRLATTSMALAAVRNEYQSRGIARDAGIVQAFLSKAILGSVDDDPKLRLNSDDDAFFQALVVTSGVGNNSPVRPSHRLIQAAFQTLCQRVHEMAEAAGDGWSGKLAAWVAYLREKVRVIVIDVPDEADAYLIFETLNDRGADLTTADLLKNYLFGISGERLDAVRDGWMRTLGALEMSAVSNLFTTFLRQYWSSRYGLTRERDLYKSIKSRITTAAQASDFVEELQEAARFYSAILSSDHEVWAPLGDGARGIVDDLLVLNLEQNRTVLLAMLKHFTPVELLQAMKSLVAWGVRSVVVGNIGGGTVERRYSDAAPKIRDGSIKTAVELFNELSAIVPSDDEFKTSFTMARVTRAKLARYYLGALERAAADTEEPELVPNADAEKVNLEHILPKNATATEWPAFTREQREDLLHRLGNMALLAKGPNDRIGNRPFLAKKPVLTASSLLLTKDAGAQPEWTPIAIHERQERLAHSAVSVWKRSP